MATRPNLLKSLFAKLPSVVLEHILSFGTSFEKISLLRTNHSLLNQINDLNWYLENPYFIYEEKDINLMINNSRKIAKLDLYLTSDSSIDFLRPIFPSLKSLSLELCPESDKNKEIDLSSLKDAKVLRDLSIRGDFSNLNILSSLIDIKTLSMRETKMNLLSIDKFFSLKELHLKDLSFVSFLNLADIFPNLEEFSVESCHSIEYIKSSSNIIRLKVNSCGNLKTICIDSPSLKELFVKDCPNLITLEFLGETKLLEFVELSDFQSLDRILHKLPTKILSLTSVSKSICSSLYELETVEELTLNTEEYISEVLTLPKKLRKFIFHPKEVGDITTLSNCSLLEELTMTNIMASLDPLLDLKNLRKLDIYCKGFPSNFNLILPNLIELIIDSDLTITTLEISECKLLKNIEIVNSFCWEYFTTNDGIIKGLDNCLSLEKLELYDFDFDDTELEKLINLKVLTLYGSGSTDEKIPKIKASVFSKLVKLEELVLRNFTFSDDEESSSLDKCSNLKELCLYNCNDDYNLNITDCKNLKCFKTNRGSLIMSSDIKKLITLVELSISVMSDITFIKNFPNLESLDIYNCPRKRNLVTLAKCIKLNYLALGENFLMDDLASFFKERTPGYIKVVISRCWENEVRTFSSGGRLDEWKLNGIRISVRGQLRGDEYPF